MYSSYYYPILSMVQFNKVKEQLCIKIIRFTIVVCDIKEKHAAREIGIGGITYKRISGSENCVIDLSKLSVDEFHNLTVDIHQHETCQ